MKTQTTLDDPVVDGAVLIGDAAGYTDPILGQGLSIALRDARIVRDQILENRDWSAETISTYGIERNERMRRIMRATQFGTTLFARFDQHGVETRARGMQRMAKQPELNALIKHIFSVASLGFLLSTISPISFAAEAATAEAVNVTILSSNLANGATIGEWGLSALVEADGHCVLFDAGRYPDTVIRNAKTLDVDLSCVTDVVLSHFHFDHTTGLMPLVRMLREKNPHAIRRVHVASGFFLSRRRPSTSGDAEWNQMIALRESFEAIGVEFIEHTKSAEIVPAVWVTGPIDRRYPEKNFSNTIQVQLNNEWVEDHVPDSQALTVITKKGHIVLLGCGHSGVGNALAHIRSKIRQAPIHALMGGLHLYAASDETLGWTADLLREIGVEHLMAGHCTGIEPLLRLRVGLNLNRRTAVVGAVGSRFVYGEGIRPTAIAM